MLYVIVTDNKLDKITIRTGCGSMSFCGAQGEEYPDTRNMGYPFTNPISVLGVDSVSIVFNFEWINQWVVVK